MTHEKCAREEGEGGDVAERRGPACRDLGLEMGFRVEDLKVATWQSTAVLRAHTSTMHTCTSDGRVNIAHKTGTHPKT